MDFLTGLFNGDTPVQIIAVGGLIIILRELIIYLRQDSNNRRVSEEKRADSTSDLAKSVENSKAVDEKSLKVIEELRESVAKDRERQAELDEKKIVYLSDLSTLVRDLIAGHGLLQSKIETGFNSLGSSIADFKKEDLEQGFAIREDITLLKDYFADEIAKLKKEFEGVINAAFDTENELQGQNLEAVIKAYFASLNLTDATMARLAELAAGTPENIMNKEDTHTFSKGNQKHETPPG